MIIRKYYNYYALIDTSKLRNSNYLLANRKIESLIKHRALGYVVKIYESDLNKIRETGTITLSVWPDGDGTNFPEVFRVLDIYKESTVLEKI